MCMQFHKAMQCVVVKPDLCYFKLDNKRRRFLLHRLTKHNGFHFLQKTNKLRHTSTKSWLNSICNIVRRLRGHSGLVKDKYAGQGSKRNMQSYQFRIHWIIHRHMVSMRISWVPSPLHLISYCYDIMLNPVSLTSRIRLCTCNCTEKCYLEEMLHQVVLLCPVAVQ